MLLATSAIVVGFIVLVWGADRFVMGAAALARNLGVSPLLIGLTIVSFGTSAPEILVSAMAAFGGTPSLAIGNAVGSNIANIGLILGVTALIAPLLFQSHVLLREYPILLAVSAGVYLLMIDGQLSFLDGLIMLAALAVTLTLLVRIGIARSASDPMSGEYEAEIRADLSTFAAVMWFLAGLALLLVSSRMLVWGAVEIATAMGVSDLVIGLTIVAIGTSLPELATSLLAAVKKEADIAVGNIVGSNIFNLLGILGITAIVHPLATGGVGMVDFAVMAAFSLVLWPMAFHQQRITRPEGAALLAGYIGYLFWLLS